MALFWFRVPRFGEGTDDFEAIGAAAAEANKFDDVGAVAVAEDLSVIGASDGVVACCTIVGALFLRRFVVELQELHHVSSCSSMSRTGGGVYDPRGGGSRAGARGVNGVSSSASNSISSVLFSSCIWTIASVGSAAIAITDKQENKINQKTQI